MTTMPGSLARLGLEWRLLRRHGALWGLLAALLALAALAAWNGRALVDARLESAGSLQQQAATTREALLKQVERDAAAPADPAPAAVKPGAVGFSVLDTYAVHPPAPLAGFALGQSDLVPQYYRVTAHAAHTLQGKPELESSLRLATGSLDLAFVVIFVLPIVIIALTFDVGSREREHGTLALAAAYGVTPVAFIGIKWLARVGLVVVPLLVVIALLAVVTGYGASLAALATWLVVVALYALTWFGLTLLVNANGRSSDRNAVLLASLWLAFVVVVPALVNLVATTLHPAPSRVELTTLVREASEAADKQAADERSAYLFDHPEAAAPGADPDEFYRILARTDANVDAAVAPALAAFDEQADDQQRVVSRLAWLSPALLAHEALLAASATDVAAQQRFREAVRRFHADWRGFFVERLERKARLTPADYAAMPAFEPPQASAGQLLSRAASPAAGLALIAAVLIIVALVRLRRTTPA